MTEGLRQTAEGIEDRVTFCPETEEAIGDVGSEGTVQERVFQRILELGDRGSTPGGHIVAQPFPAQPDLGGDGPPRQVGTTELPQVAGDHTVVLQRPLRPDVVPHDLRPDPRFPMGPLDDVETPWCYQATWQVVQ
jgi:hypothetical protein